MGIAITGQVSRAITLAFSLCSELLKPATFKKIIAYVPDPLTGVNVNQYATAEVNYLRSHFTSADSNESTIIYGDERWLIKASELAAISPQPASGDWFEVDSVRYDIQAAILDVTDSLWIFQVRRNIPTPVGAGASDDWGDLTLFTSNEGWGDLTLHDSTEDWNA